MFGSKPAYFGADVEAKPIPAPLGGWDAISPLSAMDPKYAVTLTNIVPRPPYLEIRGGYNAWAQGLNGTAPVESLMAYKPELDSEVLFAAAGNTIYNVSTYGSPITSLTGLANARWQYINFTPANSNNYLMCCNGIDSLIAWDGSAWFNPPISGLSSNTILNINAFKRRIWFTPANSTVMYYLDTDAIQGTANPFPLGSFMTKGGKLVGMGTWTIDGGTGPDDYAVFVTNKGQAIVYKGTDPSNANAFALVGVFDIPPPIGNRPFLKINSDLGLITTQGLIPLSQALPFDPSSVRSVALTNRIQNAMLQATQASNQMFGWEAKIFQLQTLLILNVPQQENSVQVQFVMNMLTGAWCLFTGWNANTFEIFNQSLYFGDNLGNVNLAYTSSLDLFTPIAAELKCAFNYFDDPGRIKNMKMVRPLLVADGSITPTLGVDADFGDTALTAPVTILTPAGGIWDISLWDSGVWSSGAITVRNWLSVTGLGTALALKMLVNIAGNSAASNNNSVFDSGTFDSAIFDGNGSTVASGQNLITFQINSFESLLEFGGPI